MNSVNAQVTKFLLELSPAGFLGRTKLVKLVYLADLEARRFMSRPITTFDYVRHHFGPWDKTFFDTWTELTDGGYAQESSVFWSFEKVEKRLQNGSPMAIDLSLADKAVLEFVAKKYIQAELDDVLRVVYMSPPMKGANKGDRLSFAEVDGIANVGFDLEQVVETEAKVLAGDYITADEWFS